MEQLFADLHIASSDETTDIRETLLAELSIDQEEIKDLERGVRPSWLDEPDYSLIKAVVLHLLKVVIRKFREENCNGCIGNQHFHQCLGPTPDYFFFNNRNELVPRVLNARFTKALDYVFGVHRTYTISPKEFRKISGAFLDGLNFAKCIEDEIIHQSERLGPDGNSVSVWKDVEYIWRGPVR